MCQSRWVDNDKLSVTSRDTNLRLGLYKCPSCGTEIEIFSDEYQVKCYQCNNILYRERMSPCIEWCTLVNECLGKEKKRQARGNI